MPLVVRGYVPADTRGSRAIVIVSWIFPATATLLVGLRFWSRRLSRLNCGVDDWILAVALIPIWGHTAIILSSVYLGGIGHHLANLEPDNDVAFYKTLTALQFSFGISLGLVKAAIICLLMRIFATKGFKLAAKILLGYVACWTITCIIIGAAMCRPFERNWNPNIQGTCGNRLAAYIAVAVSNIVGNILIIALPMPKIWKLKQNIATKIALSAVFAIGFVDVLVGSLRIVYLVGLTKTTDYTWTAVNCWVWSVLEPNLAVFVACGPTLKPVYHKLRGEGRQQSYVASRGVDEPRKSVSNEAATQKQPEPTYWIDVHIDFTPPEGFDPFGNDYGFVSTPVTEGHASTYSVSDYVPIVSRGAPPGQS